MDAVRTVTDSLARLGIRLRPEYVAAALQEGSQQGTQPKEQLQRVYAQFLTADMNACGAGCLPADLPKQHNTVLRGRYVLQVDEATDITAPVKSRFGSANSARRCLKMHLSDGQRHAAAFEDVSISKLSALGPAGLKVAITDAPIKRGMLRLRPEHVTVLGGEVERLERARMKVVEHWNQPAADCRHGRPGQAAEVRANAFADASDAAWREDIPQDAAAQHQQQQQQLQQQQQMPAASAAPAVPAARTQNRATQPALPDPGSRANGQQWQAQQAVAPLQQRQPSAPLTRAPTGNAAPREVQIAAAVQQQVQQSEVPAASPSGDSGQAGAAVRQQGQPGPSSNGAAAAIAPKESWSSDDADFQDVPQELPACQQDEFEDAQPEHLSPSESEEVLDDGAAAEQLADDADCIIMPSAMEPDQAQHDQQPFDDPTPFATPGSSAGDDGVAATEGVASHSNASSAPAAAVAAAARPDNGSVKRPASEGALEALCSATDGACDERGLKRPRLAAGADIAALLAAGWKGLGRLGGERTEPCMSRALATWPGPREAELVGSPQWLDGLTEEACPALLQLEGEISGVVSALQFMEGSHAMKEYQLLVEVDSSGCTREAMLAHHLIMDVVGCEPQAMADAMQQRRRDQVLERIATLKQALQEFHGFMLLYVSSPGAQPLVILME